MELAKLSEPHEIPQNELLQHDVDLANGAQKGIDSFNGGHSVVFTNCYMTAALIVVTHFVFFYHVYWRGKGINASAKEIFVKENYYLAFISPLCYFVGNIGSSTNSTEEESSALRGGSAAIWSSHTLRSFYRAPTSTARHIYRNVKFHGFVFMAFSSHLLWQYRSLEEFFGGFWLYGRVLFVLGGFSTILELWVLRSVSKAGRQMTDTLLMQGSRGGLSSILAALMLIYTTHFPYATIHVLPVLPSFLVKFRASDVGMLISWTFLFTSARSTHPLGPLFGLISGTMFRLGFLDWLALDSYWFSWLFVIFCVSCAAALKAGEVVNVPCIDYVSLFDRNESRNVGQHRIGVDENSEVNRIQNITSTPQQSQIEISENEVEGRTTNDFEDDEYIDMETGRSTTRRRYASSPLPPNITPLRGTASSESRNRHED